MIKSTNILKPILNNREIKINIFSQQRNGKLVDCGEVKQICEMTDRLYVRELSLPCSSAVTHIFVISVLTRHRRTNLLFLSYLQTSTSSRTKSKYCERWQLNKRKIWMRPLSRRLRATGKHATPSFCTDWIRVFLTFCLVPTEHRRILFESLVEPFSPQTSAHYKRSLHRYVNLKSIKI